MSNAKVKRVRYAVVGAGWISQAWFMPGVEHTGNSEVTALVTGDGDKAEELAKKYDIKHTYNYDGFQAMLDARVVDAIYLATPNWRHAEFAVPALRAGVHVLLEKPMEISAAKCEEILAARRASRARLMVAYRLHFDPGTLDAIERVRSGELGDVHLFTSTFTQRVAPSNHRAQGGFDAGPVADMGPYPINAARNLFGAEPTEVSAVGIRHPEAGLGDLDDTVSVVMRFPENRLAQFVVSYYGNPIDTYAVVGTKGDLVVSPGYAVGKPLEMQVTVGEKKSSKKFDKTDQFGGELKYFSDCILEDREPEPNGEEGLADVRVIEAVKRALETGQPQKLGPFTESRRIDLSQVQKLHAVKPAKMVHAAEPSKG